MSFQEIQRIFSDKTLSRDVKRVNLTGGEPTLREDIVDIVRCLVKSCKRLRSIDIPTNGIDTLKVVDKFERILAAVLPYKVRVSGTVSIDGVGPVHRRVRGLSADFNRIEQTLRRLKELAELYPYFSLGINTTVSQANASDLDEMLRYAESVGIGINFTLAAISDIGVDSVSERESFELSEAKKQELLKFFGHLLEQKKLHAPYGEFILQWLKTGQRSLPCSFRKGKTILIEPDGETYACGNFKDFKIGNIALDPFEKIRRKGYSFEDQFARHCPTCVSNCYMDET